MSGNAAAILEKNIGLTETERKGGAEILNSLLSDEYLLYTKTRNYHWNVTGPQFNDLHKFFEAQYEELNDIVDDVAERTRTLGINAFGTMSEFMKHSRLKEEPGQYPKATTMISNLLADHEAIILTLRKDLETCTNRFHDAGTTDFLTSLMEKHEKMGWMLRSYLEG